MDWRVKGRICRERRRGKRYNDFVCVCYISVERYDTCITFGGEYYFKEKVDTRTPDKSLRRSSFSPGV